MPETEIVENYLEQLLLFKERNELTSKQYKPETANRLLYDLFKSLDFDEELWDKRKSVAKIHYKIAELYKDDEEFKKIFPFIRLELVRKHLEIALALDPFNMELLRGYLVGFKSTVNRKTDFKYRYLAFLNPHSDEYQKLLLDFSINEVKDDYNLLSEEVIHPFIEQLVRIKSEEHFAFLSEVKNQKELEQIAIDGGIDSSTIEEMNQLIPDHLKTVKKVFKTWWNSWEEGVRAYQAMKKALELAPFDPEVLEYGVRFYSSIYWRLLTVHVPLKKSTYWLEELYLLVFDTKKPTEQMIRIEADRSIDYAEELLDRFLKIEKESTVSATSLNFLDQLNKIIKININLTDVLNLSEKDKSDLRRQSLLVILEKEKECQPLLLEDLNKRYQLKKERWYFGIPIFIVILTLAYLYTPLMLGVILPVLIAFVLTLLALGISMFRWKIKIRKNFDKLGIP